MKNQRRALRNNGIIGISYCRFSRGPALFAQLPFFKHVILVLWHIELESGWLSKLEHGVATRCSCLKGSGLKKGRGFLVGFAFD